jgi:hypothetical protein
LPDAPLAAGCFGGCLGLLASALAFVLLATLGSILGVFEGSDNGAGWLWLAALLGCWLGSGVIAYLIAGRLHASGLGMGLGVLAGFVLSLTLLVLLTS